MSFSTTPSPLRPLLSATLLVLSALLAATNAVIVNFWATWCGYCLKELPILENIQDKAGKKNIQVIAVNTESREVFRKASRVMKPLSLMVAHDTGSKAFTAYAGNGLPQMAIISRDGNIIRVYRGYDESSLNSIVKDVNQALLMEVPGE